MSESLPSQDCVDMFLPLARRVNAECDGRGVTHAFGSIVNPAPTLHPRLRHYRPHPSDRLDGIIQGWNVLADIQREMGKVFSSSGALRVIPPPGSLSSTRHPASSQSGSSSSTISRRAPLSSLPESPWAPYRQCASGSTDRIDPACVQVNETEFVTQLSSESAPPVQCCWAPD
jgi:hypothetical protein